MEKRLCFLAIVLMAVSMMMAGCLPAANTGQGNPVVNDLTNLITSGNGATPPTGSVVSEPEQPSIEVNPQGQYFAKITVNEGELVKLDLQASDPDGDPLTYTFSKPLNAQGEWQTKIGDAGEYPITITASDGKLETSKVVLLIIKAVNRAPVAAKQNDITLTEGQKLSLGLKATDPDNDILVWRYESDAPIGSDGSWQTRMGDAGEYDVKATVSDGYLSDSTLFKVKVIRFNNPPTLEIAKEMTVNDNGETIKLQPKVNDPDAGDTVSVSYSGWMTADTYTTKFGDAGKHLVTVLMCG
jgi:hypothetical protein